MSDEAVERRTNAVIGALVFLVALGVYAYCVTPTVPYWDSGEFIATSYTLGIPHPPGTPLYVLIGRLFTFLPFATVAVRVNLLSSLSSAIAVLFTYLIAVRLSRRILPESAPRWLAYVGGVVAAFFMAWGPTFWDNAIEAEVYGGASAIMCLCVWLALYWWDRLGQPKNDRFLWLILYVLFLAIGIHLGSFLVFPCIYLLVTMVSWERVRKGWFWGSVVVWIIAALIRSATIYQAGEAGGFRDVSMADAGTQQIANAMFWLMALAVAWNLVSVLGWRFVIGVGALAFLGVSVHLYLLLRSRLNPAINEADPNTWEALKLVLTRDQYKPPEAVFRNAPWDYQFGHMYFRYFKDQFILFGGENSATWLFPVLVGLYGAWVNFERDRKSFFLMLTLFLITGPFLVYYLNFKQGEVRERDYFFTANFHFFAIWIGMGAAHGVVEILSLLKPKESRVPAGAAAALSGVFLVSSVLPLFAGENGQNFFVHNRQGNYLAHGYGYNMLVGLEPDAILFTNGDNDTFPLWYMQEVEHFRKDVRVVNLSLLQTDWYIKQLRDDPPKVPITLTDKQVDGLRPYMDQKQKVHYVNEIMVDHIVKANNWKRPVYLAVTVPDQQGLDRQLKMEGLVFRVYKDPQPNPIDIAKLEQSLDHQYEYKGFLNADGTWNEKVYKDDQATNLLLNYSAARVRLALGLADAGREAEAKAQLDKVRKYSGHFSGVDLALGLTYEQLGMNGDALDYFQSYLRKNPDDPAMLTAVAEVQARMSDTTSAVASLRRAIQVSPASDFTPYQDLIAIYEKKNDFGSIVALLQGWVGYHPEDTRAKTFLNALLGAAPGTPGGTPSGNPAGTLPATPNQPVGGTP